MSSPKHHSGNCVKCGTWRASLHCDHILPRYKGGTNDPANLQYICGNCHEDKSRLDMLGIVRTPEQRAKISASHMGKIFTPEHRAALGRAAKGRVTSEEVRVKQRAAAKASWTPERKRRHLENRMRRTEQEIADLKRQIEDESS